MLTSFRPSLRIMLSVLNPMGACAAADSGAKSLSVNRNDCPKHGGRLLSGAGDCISGHTTLSRALYASECSR